MEFSTQRQCDGANLLASKRCQIDWLSERLSQVPSSALMSKNLPPPFFNHDHCEKYWIRTWVRNRAILAARCASNEPSHLQILATGQSWALTTIFATTRQCREAKKLSLVVLSLIYRILSCFRCRDDKLSLFCYNRTTNWTNDVI